MDLEYCVSCEKNKTQMLSFMNAIHLNPIFFGPGLKFHIVLIKNLRLPVSNSMLNLMQHKFT